MLHPNLFLTLMIYNDPESCSSDFHDSRVSPLRKGASAVVMLTFCEAESYEAILGHRHGLLASAKADF